MIKVLEKIGDRLLEKFVPTVEANASMQGCVGIYCGCIAGFDSYRIDDNHSCGKCQGSAC
jgi:hypothetical protein